MADKLMYITNDNTQKYTVDYNYWLTLNLMYQAIKTQKRPKRC